MLLCPAVQADWPKKARGVRAMSMGSAGRRHHIQGHAHNLATLGADEAGTRRLAWTRELAPEVLLTAVLKANEDAQQTMDGFGRLASSKDLTDGRALRTIRNSHLALSQQPRLPLSSLPRCQQVAELTRFEHHQPLLGMLTDHTARRPTAGRERDKPDARTALYPQGKKGLHSHENPAEAAGKM